MNPQISNTQGMSQEVQDAIARRGLNAPSQMAPSMSGGTSAPPTGGQSSTPQAQPTGQPASQGNTKFVPKDSHELLISTLNESLKNEYKLKEQELKFGAPQMAPSM